MYWGDGDHLEVCQWRDLRRDRVVGDAYPAADVRYVGGAAASSLLPERSSGVNDGSSGEIARLAGGERPRAGGARIPQARWAGEGAAQERHRRWQRRRCHLVREEMWLRTGRAE